MFIDFIMCLRLYRLIDRALEPIQHYFNQSGLLRELMNFDLPLDTFGKDSYFE